MIARSPRAVVSSVRVSAMGARQVRGAMAVAVLGEAGGGDVQILRVQTAGLASDAVQRRSARE
jgi:hypothetical protein